MLPSVRIDFDTKLRTRRETALIVARDESKREELSRACRSLGYEVLEHRDGDEQPDLVLLDGPPETGRAWRPEFDRLPLTPAKAKLIQSYERARIRAALEESDGNISRAARRLGIFRQSLQQKMREHGLRGRLKPGSNPECRNPRGSENDPDPRDRE